MEKQIQVCFLFLLDNPLYQIARETAPGETLVGITPVTLSLSPERQGGQAHPDVPPRAHPSQPPGHFLHFLNTNLFLKTLLRACFLIESSTSSLYWQHGCSCQTAIPALRPAFLLMCAHRRVSSSTSVYGIGQSVTHPLCVQSVRKTDGTPLLPSLQSPRRQGPRRFREMRCARPAGPSRWRRPSRPQRQGAAPAARALVLSHPQGAWCSDTAGRCAVTLSGRGDGWEDAGHCRAAGRVAPSEQ